jgi:DNA-binding LacI/PurR family transcriptional regulator
LRNGCWTCEWRSTGPGAAEAIERILTFTPRRARVVCLNDTAALEVLHGLEAVGVRVAVEISVVGYDDLPFAAADHRGPANLPARLRRG